LSQQVRFGLWCDLVHLFLTVLAYLLLKKKEKQLVNSFDRYLVDRLLLTGATKKNQKCLKDYHNNYPENQIKK